MPKKRKRIFKKTIHLVKRLSRYVRPYRIRFFGAMLCSLMSAILSASIIAMTKPVFNQLFRERDKDVIWMIILAMLVMAVFKSIFMYGQSYYVSFVGQRVIMDIRNKLFSHLQRLSLDYFIKHRTGNVVARITNDVLLLQRAVVAVPQIVLKEGIQGIFMAGVLFYFKWDWALIMIVIIPAISFSLMSFARKLRAYSRESQSRIADIYSFLHEKIVGVRLIKAFCMEDEEIKKFEKENYRLFNVVMRAMRVTAMQSPVMEIIGTVGVCSIIVLGAYSVIDGVVDEGTFMAFFVAMTAFFQHLRRFASINRESQEALSAAERIFYVLDSRSFVMETSDAVDLPHMEENIVFKKVSFGYTRKKKILEDFNLTVNKGEIVALIGVSGSGKTSVANLLARFYDPLEGKITIDGLDIREATLKSLRMQMGIVTQETILFNDTVRNNIAYGELDATEAQIITAAKTAGAHDFIMKMPAKYNTVIGERGVTLSGGECQRVAIARAVLKNPPILILDEATSALDSESEALVQKAIDNLMKHRTVFMITHRLSSLKRVDKIVVLDNNKVVGVGTHTELIRNNELYKRLYKLQFRIQKDS